MPIGFETAVFELEQVLLPTVLHNITLGGKLTDKYRVVSVTGLNGLPFEFNTTRNADAQSVYLESTLAQPRLITFVFEVDNIPAERELLMQFFNPLAIENTLTANWNGNERHISYIPYPILIEQSTTYSRMKCTVDLYCPEPFWVNTGGINSQIINTETTEIPTTKDEPVRYLHAVDFAIENFGDVPAPFWVYFGNDDASSCYNPKVQLIVGGKGQPFMTAETNIEPGGDVQFNTYPNDLYVAKNKGWPGEIDLENTLPPEHEYFMCPVQESTIRCTVETNDASMILITLTGSERYLGL